jgi:hypothetical protein
MYFHSPINTSVPTVVTLINTLRKNANTAWVGARRGLTRNKTIIRDVVERRAARDIPKTSVFIV